MALYVLLGIVAVFGDPETAENITPVFVYVVFWVGMTLICALVGDLWRVVNPFDTMAALVERLRGRRPGRALHVLVGTFPYSVRGLDAEALVREIAVTKPDVLFVSAYLDDGIALRKAQVSQGLGLKASIGTSSSYCMPSFAHALGPAAVGLFASDKPDGREVRLEALQPEARDILARGRDRYRQRHGRT